MASGRGSTLFPVQTADRGQSGSFENYNQATLPHNAEGQLGMVVEDDGKVYRLVQHNQGTAAIATAAGMVAYWFDRANNVVTPDVSDSNGDVAGGYHGVITHLNYTYVQIGGEQTVDLAAATTAGFALKGVADSVLTVAGLVTDYVVAQALDGNDPALVRWNVGALL